MWAIENNDKQIIKKTSSISPEEFDTKGIYSWRAIKIVNMKIENQTPYYDYREYKVYFKARLSIPTYIQTFSSHNNFFYNRLKNILLFDNYIGFFLHKEKKDSNWILGSYEIHL